MKLAELLNVDTTKENWFKLLSKKGINPKTVSAVSKGGGDVQGTKEYYYRILNDQVISMIKFLVYGEIVIEIAPGENINGTLNTLYENSTYRAALAIKMYDIKLYCLNSSDGQFNKNFGPFEGDIWNRLAAYANIAGGATSTPEQIKEQFSTAIQEITKEEYESLITQ